MNNTFYGNIRMDEKILLNPNLDTESKSQKLRAEILIIL